jgi:hypothetical protein
MPKMPICAHFGVVQSGFLLNFDIDNCLLKKCHYIGIISFQFGIFSCLFFFIVTGPESIVSVV